MAHKLVYYGNKTLHQVAAPVHTIDDATVDLVDAMFNVMYRARGIGLAAPQVEESQRLIVVDTDGYEGGMVIPIINPVIKEFSDTVEPYDEGCLSVPGITREVVRPVEILVTGVDLAGNPLELELGGLTARVVQHEVDHLDGILFIDRLEDYVRNELRPELKKIKKMNDE